MLGGAGVSCKGSTETRKLENVASLVVGPVAAPADAVVPNNHAAFQALAVPFLSFVGQFSLPPDWAVSGYSHVLQTLHLGPYNSITGRMLTHFKALGLPYEFIDLSSMVKASMFKPVLRRREFSALSLLVAPRAKVGSMGKVRPPPAGREETARRGGGPGGLDDSQADPLEEFFGSAQH